MNLSTIIKASSSVRKATAAATAMFLFLTSGYAAAWEFTGRWMDPAVGDPRSSFGGVHIPRGAALCFGGAPTRHIYVQGIRVSLMGGLATEYRQYVRADYYLYRYNPATGTWPLAAQPFQRNSPVMSFRIPGAFEVEIPQLAVNVAAGYYQVRVRLTWRFAFQESYWYTGSSQDIDFNHPADYTTAREFMSEPGQGYCRVL